uniref:Uncharacterized protein n=1 Tax=Arundo donax TaxID=35708 RepID=A0A0A9FYW1_ARUDO
MVACQRWPLSSLDAFGRPTGPKQHFQTEPVTNVLQEVI